MSTVWAQLYYWLVYQLALNGLYIQAVDAKSQSFVLLSSSLFCRASVLRFTCILSYLVEYGVYSSNKSDVSYRYTV
jgi:hypothetical protein